MEQFLFQKLEPGFYWIGAFLVAILLMNGRTLIEIRARRNEKSEDELKEMGKAIVRLETKLDDLTRDVNNIGAKIRGQV